MPRTTRARILQELIAQQRWIADHGGSRAGYVARYGSRADPDRGGDGGEAIYAADTAALVELQIAYVRCQAPRQARVKNQIGRGWTRLES